MKLTCFADTLPQLPLLTLGISKTSKIRWFHFPPPSTFDVPSQVGIQVLICEGVEEEQAAATWLSGRRLILVGGVYSLAQVGAGVSSLHEVALFLPLTWNRRYVAHICEFLKNLTNKKALRLRLVSTVLYRLAPASPLETNFGAAYLSYFYTSPFGTEYLAISTSETPFFVANRSTIIMEHPRPWRT